AGRHIRRFGIGDEISARSRSREAILRITHSPSSFLKAVDVKVGAPARLVVRREASVCFEDGSFEAMRAIRSSPRTGPSSSESMPLALLRWRHAETIQLLN